MKGLIKSLFGKSVALRVNILILMIALIPLIVGTVYNYYTSKAFLTQTRLQGLEQASLTIANSIEQLFKQNATDIRIMANQAFFKNALSESSAQDAWLQESVRQMLHFQKSANLRIDEFCLIAKDGRELARVTRGVAATPEELSPDESKNIFFQPTIVRAEGEIYQSQPYISPDTNRWVVATSAPVVTAQGTEGIIHFEVYLEEFQGLVNANTGENGKSGIFGFIANEKNQYIVKGNDEVITNKAFTTLEERSKVKSYQNAADNFKNTDLGAVDFVSGAGVDHFIFARSLKLPDGNINKWKIGLQAEANNVPLKGSRLTNLLILIMATFAGLFVFSFLVTRQFTNPLKEMVSKTEAITSGDLEAKVEVRSENEFGRLGTSINKMTGALKDMIQTESASKEALKAQVKEIISTVHATSQGYLNRKVQTSNENIEPEILQLSKDLNQMIEALRSIVVRIREASTKLSVSSSDILATSEEQASGASQQAAAVAETTATIEELAATAKQVAENTESVSHLADQSLQRARSGEEFAERSMDAITEIQQTTKATADKILALGEKSQQIGAVLQIINDIAEQTNLLAFNAAIEAARAGEAGKGFSIVASEIRRLAEDVKVSTKEISDLIGEIQSAINSSVLATEDAINKTEKGVDLSRDTGESFRTILDMAETTTQSAHQITIATQQQRSASEQIVATMREISDVTQQAAMNSKEVIKSTESLALLSQELKSIVDTFKLQDEQQF